ncbi:Site-specific recombinase XerD [Tsukamurella pulmonis]|uniref:Site-specific recombinase XerD n=1 Tax=Tsukamurella pulmonis TaxID=47312 RepID=A0A1H1H606_9ACTN|nr:site-specific integrase [Tsukamurella pulmonis]SDR20922.1 Site-specific recombinase XerD [Tsukamurella pulmonis]SUP15833.1 Integrase [Tsukamurella pulmonis]
MPSTISPTEDLWRKSDGSESARAGRGKRWRVRWEVDGDWKSKSFHRKAEAELYRRELTTDLTIGKYVDEKAAQTTIEALWVRWSAMDGGITQRTKESREAIWRKHVKPQWSKTAVGDIGRPKVKAWVASMKRDGVGVPTIEKAVGVLRGILDLAIDDRRAVANAADKIPVGKRQTKPRPYLTAPQVEALARTVEDLPVVSEGDRIDAQGGLVIRLLAFTGLRWGEMIALRVEDCDMLRKRLHVHRAITESEEQGVIEGNVKDHERRWIPIPARLLEPLAAQMHGKARADHVFHTASGTPLLVSNWRPRTFNKARARVQSATEAIRTEEAKATVASAVKNPTPPFPTVTPHDLRHAYASLAVSAGANVKALQRALGHAKASMTLDTYADLFDEDLDGVAVRLDVLVSDALSRLPRTENVPRTGTP